MATSKVVPWPDAESSQTRLATTLGDSTPADPDTTEAIAAPSECPIVALYIVETGAGLTIFMT
jgi:hypothetical protein